MRSEPQGEPGQYNQVMTWTHFLPVTDILVCMTYALTWASLSPGQLDPQYRPDGLVPSPSDR